MSLARFVYTFWKSDTWPQKSNLSRGSQCRQSILPGMSTDAQIFLEFYHQHHPQHMGCFCFVPYFASLTILWHLPLSAQIQLHCSGDIQSIPWRQALGSRSPNDIMLSPEFGKQSGWDPWLAKRCFYPHCIWNCWVKEDMHFNLRGIWLTIQPQS